MLDIYRRAVSYFGATKQKLKAIEEMAELIVELVKDLLGDGLAHWIHENPDKYRSGRRFMRRVLEDFYPDWVAYWLDGWKMRLVGCAALFGVLYGFAALMQQIGA